MSSIANRSPDRLLRTSRTMWATPLKADEYRCGRCGVVAKFMPRRYGRPHPRPDFCPDCRGFAKDYR